MRVVVASHNPVKVGAAREAFSACFAEADLEVVSVSVESGVAAQPKSDADTRRGARNRADNAREARPDADYWVGLEGGIETIDDGLVAFAWMVVRDRDGRMGEARSVTLPLPPAVKALVDEGMELGEANDRVFDTVDSKRKGGAFGLLTDGLLTRQSVYAKTIIAALVPLTSGLFR